MTSFSLRWPADVAARGSARRLPSRGDSTAGRKQTMTRIERAFRHALAAAASAGSALCAAQSPLSGMVPMYVLMSAFHLAPWLKLVRDT